MNRSFLHLPLREKKPRNNGLTILIDNGYSTNYFKDIIISHAPFIDFVKFGWGTSIITRDLEDKIECLTKNEVDFFFGGTLFEKFLSQKKIDEYYRYCQKYETKYIEISNGTIDMTNKDKARFIADFSKEFIVFSEVGAKDSEKCLTISPAKWIEYITEDLEAGAQKVITEARESGTSGICRPNGELRYGLIEEMLESSLDTNLLIFEAPVKSLQTYFIRKIGPNVNLANIPFSDVIPLETLRLGLRADTFYYFEDKETSIQ